MSCLAQSLSFVCTVIGLAYCQDAGPQIKKDYALCTDKLVKVSVCSTLEYHVVYVEIDM